MCKLKFNQLLFRLLQQDIASVLFRILGTVAVVQFFAYHGHYNYDHIPEDTIHYELYRSTIPSVGTTHKDCDYDEILINQQSIEPWTVLTRRKDFSPLKIQNGSFTPSCTPAFSVAIIVAFRSGEQQLDIFLPYMHDFLRAQSIHYKIYLIKHCGENPLNKGFLYNIGAKRAIADKFPCLILHDVDLLPLDAANLYACTQEPRHLSASIDKFRYVLPYTRLVGGVLAIRADHYDGFSDAILHTWGEGVDLYERIIANGYNVIRFPRRMARYTMLPPDPRHRERNRILRENRQLDATPNVSIEVMEQKLFTLIEVK